MGITCLFFGKIVSSSGLGPRSPSAAGGGKAAGLELGTWPLRGEILQKLILIKRDKYYNIKKRGIRICLTSRWSETIGKVGKGREHSKFYVVLLDNVGQLH